MNIQRYIIREDELLAVAYWKTATVLGHTLFVVNEQEELVGFVNNKWHFPDFYDGFEYAKVSQGCRPDVQYVTNCDDVYGKARDIFSKFLSISTLPVGTRNIKL